VVVEEEEAVEEGVEEEVEAEVEEVEADWRVPDRITEAYRLKLVTFKIKVPS
jgi:hypothetical protein